MSPPLDINVKGVGGYEALIHASAADADWKACAHLGPDQCHLGAKSKLASGLLDTVFGAGQDPAKQVRNVLVDHAHPIVLQHGHSMNTPFSGLLMHACWQNGQLCKS